MGFECSLIWLIAVGAPLALFGIINIFAGKSISSFQIHDDCPEWFLKRVNAKLDKMFEGRSDAALS